MESTGQGAITFVRAPRPAACIQLLRTMIGALNHARAAPCRSEQVLMNLNVTRLQKTVLVARALLGTFGEVLPESNTVPWAKPCVGRAGAAGFDAYSPFACYFLSYGEQGNKS